jgi:hypothetical protein
MVTCDAMVTLNGYQGTEYIFTMTGRDTIICPGSDVDLSTLINGSPQGDLEYGVNFGNYNGTDMVSPLIPTTYYIRDSTGITCKDTAQITVFIHPQPLITGQDTAICEGSGTIDLSLLVDGTIVNALEYKEEGGTYSTDPIFLPTIDPTTYIVRDSSATGCSDTAKIVVNIDPQPLITGRDTTVCMDAMVILSGLITGDLVDDLEFGTAFGIYEGPATIQATGTETYYVRDSSNETGCVDTAKITVNVLTTIECLMSFESGNELSFGDPCLCETVERVEGLYYFRDTLVIEAPTEQTILFSTANVQDFYITPGVLMPNNTPIPEGLAGTYKFEFYKLSNVQAAGSVTLNGGNPFPIPEEDLEFCFVNVDCPALVPTMGQWGTIVCLILLLIMGLIGLKSLSLEKSTKLIR